jgi:hypothetical protein
MSVVLRSEDGGIHLCRGCVAWRSFRADLMAGAGYPDPVWLRTCDVCGEWAWVA